MKKLLLFIGVIILCLLFSCKKDSISSQTPPPPPPPPFVDSFLLHPPLVLDSLPISFTTGTWWKYQRNDSARGTPPGFPICCVLYNIDSSIELLTVIGQVPYIVTVNEIKNNIITRTRYDTVNAFMLEVKNLTKGTLDTNYAYYYNSSFNLQGKNEFSNYIHVPIIEGTQNISLVSGVETYIVKRGESITILNNSFDNCIYNEFSWWSGWPDRTSESKKSYLKPGVGFVDWEFLHDDLNHYSGSNTNWDIRKLIDYHIAP